ncbi:MAG TPA: hypothetical protein VFY56_14415 [Propionibacteriaceae bacterium]|nr:hypothetical protein [Propionibacteriaceae bacterium]
MVSAIIILTLVGRELGISQLLPEDEREIDDRDTSLTRLVAITLLPFLGIYAAFGQVTEAAQRLVTQQWVRYGFLSSEKTILGVLNDLATNHRFGFSISPRPVPGLLISCSTPLSIRKLGGDSGILVVESQVGLMFNGPRCPEG